MVIAIILLAILFIVGFINTLYSMIPTTKKISAWLLSNSFNKPNSPTTVIESPNTRSETNRKEDELRRVFETFDTNGDGYVTRQELKESLKNIGICMNEKETGELIEKLDENGDGLIDLHEFCKLFESMIQGDGKEKDVLGKEEVGEEELKEAFSVFDGNKNGLITVEELFLVLSSLGLKEGENIEDCKDMIRKVDLDGDGMVNFAEFKRMMKSGLRLQVTDS